MVYASALCGLVLGKKIVFVFSGQTESILSEHLNTLLPKLPVKGMLHPNKTTCFVQEKQQCVKCHPTLAILLFIVHLFIAVY